MIDTTIMRENAVFIIPDRGRVPINPFTNPSYTPTVTETIDLQSNNVYIKKLTYNEVSEKTYEADVPYRSGTLDLSFYTGKTYPVYYNRDIVLQCKIFANWIEAEEIYRKLSAQLSGKYGKICINYTVDTDGIGRLMPDYFYGKITVGRYQTGTFANFEIKLNCDPYRYSELVTTDHTIYVSGTGDGQYQLLPLSTYIQPVYIGDVVVPSGSTVYIRYSDDWKGNVDNTTWTTFESYTESHTGWRPTTVPFSQNVSTRRALRWWYNTASSTNGSFKMAFGTKTL